MKKGKVLYIDMDNVLVDFQSGLDKVDEKTLKKYEGHEDDIPGIFALMGPIPGAIDAYNFLSKHFDTYILTTAPWANSTALQDKRDWVGKYLPENGYKRLIISHHKNLCIGEYIIDDRTARGVDQFEGEHIHFGQGDFLKWDDVVKYLCEREGI
jgi:5'(3')-deoxyribonucleotidase